MLTHLGHSIGNYQLGPMLPYEEAIQAGQTLLGDSEDDGGWTSRQSFHIPVEQWNKWLYRKKWNVSLSISGGQQQSRDWGVTGSDHVTSINLARVVDGGTHNPMDENDPNYGGGHRENTRTYIGGSSVITGGAYPGFPDVWQPPRPPQAGWWTTTGNMPDSWAPKQRMHPCFFLSRFSNFLGTDAATIRGLHTGCRAFFDLQIDQRQLPGSGICTQDSCLGNSCTASGRNSYLKEVGSGAYTVPSPCPLPPAPCQVCYTNSFVNIRDNYASAACSIDMSFNLSARNGNGGNFYDPKTKRVWPDIRINADSTIPAGSSQPVVNTFEFGYYRPGSYVAGNSSSINIFIDGVKLPYGTVMTATNVVTINFTPVGPDRDL